jgi:hypothetical protein
MVQCNQLEKHMSGHAFSNPGNGGFNNQGFQGGQPQQNRGGQPRDNQHQQQSGQNRPQPPARGQGYQSRQSGWQSNQNQGHQQVPTHLTGPQGGQQAPTPIAQPGLQDHHGEEHHQAPHIDNQQQNTNAQHEDRDYRMLAAYGKRSALQFKPTGTRISDTRKFSSQTIMIEGAMRLDPNNPRNRAYDWAQKISVQVTLSELPIVIGVLLGLAPSCQFSNHGRENDKAFNFELQENKHFFVSVMQGGKNAVGVQVPLVDAMQIGHLALSQYLQNFPGINSETALRNIQTLCNMMNNANSFPLKKSFR